MIFALLRRWWLAKFFPAQWTFMCHSCSKEHKATEMILLHFTTGTQVHTMYFCSFRCLKVWESSPSNLLRMMKEVEHD